MPVNFLSLPLDIRERIYEYVWCSCSAHIVDSVVKESLGRREEVRFPEDVEERYPPPEDEVDDLEEEGDGDGDGDGDEEEDEDWEDDADGSDLSELIEELNADDEDDDVYDGFDENGDDDDNLDSAEEENDPEPLYTVQSSKHLHTSLLTTSHQINTEALPIFYRTITFTLDTNGHTALKFLRALPERARTNISTITLTSATLNHNDTSSRKVWSGTTTSPKFAGPPKLITKMGAFLAEELPALEVVSFYFPFGGGEERYCPWAPTELLMLLWHRRISLLNFVFLGSRVAKTLRESSGSDECYETFMGDWGEDAEINLGEHIFELENRAPEGEYSEEFRERCRVYFAARDEFAKGIDEGEEGLIWEWTERKVEMGRDGNVQAVVSMWMTTDEGNDDDNDEEVES